MFKSRESGRHRLNCAKHAGLHQQSCKPHRLNGVGQLSIYDAIIALVVFMLIYFSMNSLWNMKMQQTQQLQGENEMQFKALRAITILTKTTGIPFNWEKKPNDTNALGLLNRGGEIEKQKMLAFGAMDYNTAQFALKVAPFDFRFEFDAPGITDDNAIGWQGIIDANVTVIALERAVKYNGGSAIVRFKIFR